jgi:hypothetical protein
MIRTVTIKTGIPWKPRRRGRYGTPDNTRVGMGHYRPWERSPCAVGAAGAPRLGDGGNSGERLPGARQNVHSGRSESGDLTVEPPSLGGYARGQTPRADHTL